MIGAIVAEYFGGSFNALGVLIRSDAQILDFQTAWAGILVARCSGSRSIWPSSSPSGCSSAGPAGRRRRHS